MKITTKQELIDYIAQCKQSQTDVVLAYANGTNKFTRISTYEYTSHFIIGNSIHSNGEGTEFLFVNGTDAGSLRDHHLLEQSYNDNWWFTTKEEAEAYIMPNYEKVKQMLLNNISSDQYTYIIYAIDQMLNAKVKINAIKFVRGLSKCTLKEAKDFVEYHYETRPMSLINL